MSSSILSSSLKKRKREREREVLLRNDVSVIVSERNVALAQLKSLYQDTIHIFKIVFAFGSPTSVLNQLQKRNKTHGDKL